MHALSACEENLFVLVQILGGFLQLHFPLHTLWTVNFSMTFQDPWSIPKLFQDPWWIPKHFQYWKNIILISKHSLEFHDRRNPVSISILSIFLSGTMHTFSNQCKWATVIQKQFFICSPWTEYYGWLYNTFFSSECHPHSLALSLPWD